MADLTQPSEIAREALRRLAARRLPPTPDNYRSLYQEISGAANEETFPERSLKLLGAQLPRSTGEQLRFARLWDTAVADQDWNGLRAALTSVVERDTSAKPWAALIRDLLAELERRHSGYTPAKKRESLEHILSSSGADPDQLHQRLQSLIRSWSQAPDAVDEPAGANAAEAPAPDGGWPALREVFAQILRDGFGTLLADAPDLVEEASQIADAVRSAADTASLKALQARLKKFAFRLQWVAEDQLELKSAMLHLIQLIIENIGELVIEDQWLNGQMGMVQDLLAQPISVRQLDDAERKLKDVIYRQGVLKKSLNDARDRLKAMLASFVDHLAGFTEVTGEYHHKMERCAARISAASDITELSDVVEEVMQETRLIQLNALRSRDELADMRARVEDAEREVARLQQDLAQTSQLVRQDPLTGTLNRKGLDETLAREVARSERRRSPLSLALLDVDNFKKLNDSHGHQAGDEALVHLARVVRETLRPQDTVARYGGEEFVIILPDTEVDDAANALVRLQRELTRRYFVLDNQRILITFSAGVASLQSGEAPAAALTRADAAMYEAKHSGKNRVVAARE